MICCDYAPRARQRRQRMARRAALHVLAAPLRRRAARFWRIHGAGIMAQARIALEAVAFVFFLACAMSLCLVVTP